MSIDGIGKNRFSDIHELKGEKLYQTQQKRESDAIKELSQRINSNADLTKNDADTLLSHRLNSRLASTAIENSVKGSLLYQNKQNTIDNIVKDSIYDKATYKGKVDGADIYSLDFNENNKQIVGLPQYIVADGDDIKIVTDEDFNLTDKLINKSL